MFEKEHKNVLSAIDNIIGEKSGFSEEFNRLKFKPVKYKDGHGQERRCFALSRDGFTALAMGFTGKKADHFKELYINRFNEMEKFISNLVVTRKEFPFLTEQIKTLYPDSNLYVYSNECDMINRIVIGMSAKQYRDVNGIEKGESIRPYLRADQIAMLEFLQKMDAGLMLGVSDYQQRKNILELAAIKNAGKYGTKKESVAILSGECEME